MKLLKVATAVMAVLFTCNVQSGDFEEFPPKERLSIASSVCLVTPMYESISADMQISEAFIEDIQFYNGMGYNTENCSSVIKVLVSVGADVNATSLHQFVWRLDKEIIRLLLSFPDIEVNAIGKNNNTALDDAESIKVEIQKALDGFEGRPHDRFYTLFSGHLQIMNEIIDMLEEAN
jgi:hypothetical protein